MQTQKQIARISPDLGAWTDRNVRHRQPQSQANFTIDKNTTQ